MDVLVVAPVLHRAWVLPHWFAHVEAACAAAGVHHAYAFVGDQAVDRDTWDTIDMFAGERLAVAIDDPEPAERRDVRDWSVARYERMVELRNRLLATARDLRPSWVLSVDSDILLHPDSVWGALAALVQRDWDACGIRANLRPRGRSSANYARFEGRAQTRRDIEGVFPVDVVMAAKLLTPAAYHVDYCLDARGEDYGWSAACRERGLRLGWWGTAASKHVMGDCSCRPKRRECADCRRRNLEEPDARCGY